ncbi:hypothetical protein ACWAT4_21425 [Bradyrhizobium manausense]
MHDSITALSAVMAVRYRRIAIDKLDQGNVQVSSIHDARVPAGSPEAELPPTGQQAGGRSDLVTFRRAAARRCLDSARSHLLQLPKGTHEACAKAENDEQQQEGLVGGRDVHHGIG